MLRAEETRTLGFGKLSRRAVGARALTPLWGLLALLVAALLPVGGASAPAPPRAAPPETRLLMAHYMPWFQARPFSAQWGWHWTMNHYDPDRVTDGRREAASHYRPLMGLYDSGDPDALQCQALLLKLAGFDGVIFDWYGTDDYRDYAAVNRSTERMIPILRRAGLRFAVCYETQTVPSEIAGGVFPATDAVAHGQRLLSWMAQNFFSAPNSLRLAGRPVLLSFGSPYYKNDEWERIFAGMRPRPLYFTEGDRQEPTSSSGGFDWPAPGGGTAQALAAQNRFYARAHGWPFSVAAAFPRFDDIYAEAGVGKSWGHIDDDDGRTYEDTLTKALQSRAPVVQIVTWNDWGEGTQIEPSVEFGYRDLEATQRLRRKYLDPDFTGRGPGLRLPIRWYLLCKKYADAPAVRARLAAFFPLVAAGHLPQAEALLARYTRK